MEGITITKKILVVDDEKDICRLMKELLGSVGYKVTTTMSGKAALARLKKEKVDLVLLDFFMPGMSGRTVAEEIRKDSRLNNLKIAFVTVAQYGDQGIKELRKLKIEDYIKKPFENHDFLSRVRKIIGR